MNHRGTEDTERKALLPDREMPIGQKPSALRQGSMIALQASCLWLAAVSLRAKRTKFSVISVLRAQRVVN